MNTLVQDARFRRKWMICGILLETLLLLALERTTTPTGSLLQESAWVELLLHLASLISDKLTFLATLKLLPLDLLEWGIRSGHHGLMSRLLPSDTLSHRILSQFFLDASPSFVIMVSSVPKFSAERTLKLVTAWTKIILTLKFPHLEKSLRMLKEESCNTYWRKSTSGKALALEFLTISTNTKMSRITVSSVDSVLNKSILFFYYQIIVMFDEVESNKEVGINISKNQ